MIDRNMGRFKLSVEFVRSEPEKAAEIFKLMKCVPIRVETLFHNDEIEYIAISELFPEIEEGGLIPEYYLKITTNKNGDLEGVEAIHSGIGMEVFSKGAEGIKCHTQSEN